MKEIVFASLDFVQDIIAVVCGVLLLRAVGDYRERSRLVTVITAVFSAVLAIAANDIFINTYLDILGLTESSTDYIDLLGFFMGVVSIIVWIGAPMIILRVTQKLKAGLLLFALMSLTELPEGLFFILVSNGNLSAESAAGKWTDLISVILIIISYLIVAVLLLSYTRRSRLLVLKNVFETAPPWAYLLIFVISTFAYVITDGIEVIDIVSNIIIFMTIIGIIGGFAYLFRSVSALNLKYSEILKKFDDQQTGYEKMLRSDEQLREFRHDYKNHMMVVTALLNAGKTEEASEYLETIKIQSGIIGRQFSTGNFIVDAILNNKNSLAEEFAIKMSVSGAVPEEGIENADICTIVSNLIDNAIEGTKRYEGDRYIKVKSSIRNGFLALSVINPVGARIDIKNNRIKTTKQDSKNHGIGLRNVQRTAEKYGGAMLLDCTDTEFTADVTVKLEH